MIKRTLLHIWRIIAIYLVNHVYNGTNPHYFGIKRILLQSIGYKIGDNTKIVAPIFNTGKLIIGNNCWIGENFCVKGNGTVILGNNIDIGPDVAFYTGTHKIGNCLRRAGDGYNCT